MRKEGEKCDNKESKECVEGNLECGAKQTKGEEEEEERGKREGKIGFIVFNTLEEGKRKIMMVTDGGRRER